MGFLKGIGYALAATFVVVVLGVVGAIVSAIAAAFGAILTGAGVIAFVAYCLQDYRETKKTRPTTGEQGGGSER